METVVDRLIFHPTKTANEKFKDISGLDPDVGHQLSRPLPIIEMLVPLDSGSHNFVTKTPVLCQNVDDEGAKPVIKS